MPSPDLLHRVLTPSIRLPGLLLRPLLLLCVMCSRCRCHGHPLAVCRATGVHHVHQHIGVTQVSQEGVATAVALVGPCRQQRKPT